jgi:peptide deformylase
VLRQKAKPVKKINQSLRKLLDDMEETMRAAPGIGLAAPQVGISKRVVVVDVGDGLFELINPEITRRSGDLGRSWEGCLSIPGYVGLVERDREITVKATDRHGKQYWIEADGLLAICLQHEIDHLDGVLYPDIALEVKEAAADDDEDDADDGGDGYAGDDRTEVDA